MENKKKKVCVIGCGIGGATAVYYLQTMFPEVEIVIYEKNYVVGGRSNCIKVEDKTIELGAQFFNFNNHNLVKFAKENKIEYKKIEKNKYRTVLFDGEQVIFDNNKYFSSLRFMYHFGFTPMYYLNNLINSKKKDFLEIYSVINMDTSSKAFENPKQLTDYIKYSDLIEVNAKEYLEKKFNKVFIEEFIQGVMRIIYNQNIEDMNGVACMISLIGMMEDSYVFPDGGRKLIESLVQNKNNVKVNINTSVKSIEMIEENDKKFKVITNQKNKELFDVVILAAPFEQAKIQLKNLPHLKNLENMGNYQKVYVYIVKGHINEKFFKLKETEFLQILTTPKIEEKVKGFNSLNYSCTIGDHFVYKIESTEKFSQKEFETLFEEFIILKEHFWEFAYPKLTPVNPEKLCDFRLFPGFYYVNAMEKIASCMEMESVSAQNIVKLIAQNEFKDN
jgi:phytoene dehydrogenase-like protein